MKSNIYFYLLLMVCTLSVIVIVTTAFIVNKRMVYNKYPIKYESDIHSKNSSIGLNVTVSGKSSYIKFQSDTINFKRTYSGAIQMELSKYYFRLLKKQNPKYIGCYTENKLKQDKQVKDISFIYSSKGEKGFYYFVDLLFYIKFKYRYAWILVSFLKIGLLFLFCIKGKFSLSRFLISIGCIILSEF